MNTVLATKQKILSWLLLFLFTIILVNNCQSSDDPLQSSNTSEREGLTLWKSAAQGLGNEFVPEKL